MNSKTQIKYGSQQNSFEKIPVRIAERTQNWDVICSAEKCRINLNLAKLSMRRILPYE